MSSANLRPATNVIAVSNARFPSATRLEFDVMDSNGTADTVWFEADVPVAQSASPLLPAVVPIAMRANSQISLSEAQDPVALENAKRAQQLMSKWFGRLNLVPLDAPTETDARTTEKGVGCFFSGGVDSYYSVLDNLQDITHLIFVHGFDIDVSKHELAQQAVSEARAASTALGKELVVVRTNVRSMSDRYVDWGKEYHGAALAAVGLLLSNRIGQVIVPASYHTSDLFPWGSHPDLDPLWSSSNLTILHHGEDKKRPEKVALISSNSTAMAHLRVCWENRDGRFNCGECEKCVRTMINLRAAGALNRCRTLPHEIDPSSLKRIRSGHGAALFAKENLEALTARGIGDPELERALRSVICSAPFWDALRKLRTFSVR